MIHTCCYHSKLFPVDLFWLSTIYQEAPRVEEMYWTQSLSLPVFLYWFSRNNWLAIDRSRLWKSLYLASCVRICLQCRRPGFDPWIGKIPRGRGMAIHSHILAWRIPQTEEPGRLQSLGPQRVRHDWTTNTFTLMCKILLFQKHCIFVINI